MNEIVNKFSLVGDKICLKSSLDNLDLHLVLVDHLQKTKEENKKLKKGEI